MLFRVNRLSQLTSQKTKVFLTSAFMTLALCVVASAQNVNVSTPFSSNSSSYFENTGVNFGFTFPGGRGNGSRVVGLGPQGQLRPNVGFQRGGGGAIPIFGGYNPATAARFGLNRRNSNGSGYSLGLTMSKGSNRQSITTTPSLTVQNGFGGSISSGQFSPFVTGVIPVVGQSGFSPNFNTVYQPDNGVTRAIRSGQLNLDSPIQPEATLPSGPANYSHPQSSAKQGDLSIKQIKANRNRRLALRSQQLQSTLSEAKQLEAEQDYAMARTKYREALLQTSDDLIKAKIKSMIKATRLKD